MQDNEDYSTFYRIIPDNMEVRFEEVDRHELYGNN